MKYKVGQVFYLVGSETAKVIPFRIVEEVTRTTLKGIEKTFIAELPDNKSTKIDVSKLKGDIFDNLESLRDHMLENAREAIASMIDNALRLSDAAFETNFLSGYEEEPEEEEQVYQREESRVQSDTPSDKVRVDLGNGLVAKINVKELEKVSQI